MSRTASPTMHTNGGNDIMSGPKLAALLRECANHVEKNEWSPVVYEALGELHAWCAGTSNGASAAVKQSGSQESWDETNVEAARTAGSSSSTAVAHAHQKHFNLSKLGKKFGQAVGLAPTNMGASTRDLEKNAAASQKNAARAKADLQAELGTSSAAAAHQHESSSSQEWCEEHFCVGCACKQRKQQQPTAAAHVATATSAGAASAARSESTAGTTSTTTAKSRPAFQRPTNPKSTLIANGWMEQQRRSKMRVVWKEVLASLVEGRRDGEETTLWIQREVFNGSKTELEALHQIPIKWVQSVEYLDYSTDHRFAVKVYNVPDDFLFRCADEDSAQNWVLTLRSVKEIAARAAAKGEKEHAPPPHDEVPRNESPTHNESSTATQETIDHRMPIKELRAIAHGHGISTVGMERADLERVVARIIAGGSLQSPPQQKAATAETKTDQNDSAEEAQRMKDEEEMRRKAAERSHAEAEAQRRARHDEVRRRQEEELRRREEENRRRQAAEAEELRRRQATEEEQRRRAQAAAAEAEAQRRRQAEEEQRRRQAAEEAQRRQAAEEAQRRQAAEEAQRRQWQQQQQWHQQQQWQQQQNQQRQWQQHQQFHGQQQAPPHPQQQFHGARGPPPAGPPPPGAQHPPPPPHASPASDKYAKMAHQTEDGAQASITAIKHSILIHWALQPPQLQMLRPIEVLLTTVHNVFPPSFGVAGHEYFKKWKPLVMSDLTHGGPMGNAPDDAKLKKAVRKLRFFLHPDKLPSDLNESQTFMCKMLWDITNDAFEEFHNKNEALDWIRK